MDEEVPIYYTLWQKILSAQRLWGREIEKRHDAEIEMLDVGPLLLLKNEVWWEGMPLMEDVHEVRDAAELAFYEIEDKYGDPYKGLTLRYKHTLDPLDREPIEVIAEEAKHFIDIALIGPTDRVVELLASDVMLLDAARSRAREASETGIWRNRIGELVALADSKRAFDAVSKLC